MKILLIGCVKSSERFLRKLTKIDVELVGVVTKKESILNADYVDIGAICKKKNIPYLYVNSANSYESISFIKKKSPDILCCFGWSELLSNDVIGIANIVSIGFHPSALPLNKGRHPLIWALALGLDKTASTFFVMDSKADAGDILSQSDVRIEYEDDAQSLYDKVIDTAEIQLEEMLLAIKKGDVVRNPQSKEVGNFWRKRERQDGKIDWRMSSRSIYNLVRALTRPYVGAHFIFEGRDVKVWKVKEVFLDNIDNIEPGKVIKGTNGGNPIIKSGENAIEIIKSDEIVLKEGEYL